MYFKVAWACKTPFVLILDRNYKVMFDNTLHQICKSVKEWFKYTIDIQDCDDAAWEFKAQATRLRENGVGFIIGIRKWGLHAWNIVLTNTGIVQVEPQLGKIVSKGYRPFVVIM